MSTYYKVMSEDNSQVLDVLSKIKYVGLVGTLVKGIPMNKNAIGIFNHNNTKIFNVKNIPNMATTKAFSTKFPIVNANLYVISENEYLKLATALAEPKPQTTKVETPEEVCINTAARKAKLAELSSECQKRIIGGFDFSQGNHVDYTLEDQINLLNIKVTLTTGVAKCLFHFKGQPDDMFSSELLTKIISAGESWKNYHLARYNRLKQMVNSAENVDEINAITYDSDIPYSLLSTEYTMLYEEVKRYGA